MPSTRLSVGCRPFPTSSFGDNNRPNYVTPSPRILPVPLRCRFALILAIVQQGQLTVICQVLHWKNALIDQLSIVLWQKIVWFASKVYVVIYSVVINLTCLRWSNSVEYPIALTSTLSEMGRISREDRLVIKAILVEMTTRLECTLLASLIFQQKLAKNESELTYLKIDGELLMTKLLVAYSVTFLGNCRLASDVASFGVLCFH